jgi:hypothetical protein
VKPLHTHQHLRFPVDEEVCVDNPMIYIHEVASCIQYSSEVIEQRTRVQVLSDCKLMLPAERKNRHVYLLQTQTRFLPESGVVQKHGVELSRIGDICKGLEDL